MTQAGKEIKGQCHCGRVQVRVSLSRPAEEIELRSCQCSFCRRHGARTFADPNGRAVIETEGPENLRRYRFALKTADFLVCAECGIYIGVLLESEGAQLVTLNAAGLDIDSFRERAAQPVSYESEGFEERVRRRLTAWMPAEVMFPAVSKEERAPH
jgi:hypothetical protein